MYNVKKRTVIVNKRRFLTALIIAIVIVNLLIVYPCMPKSTQADSVQKTMTVQVSAGDTLWSIAENFCESNSDIRNYVYSIKKLNALKDATLIVGQKLIIPIN